MTTHLARFCQIFRTELNTSLEYSVSEDLGALGIMVRGDHRIVDRISAFAGSLVAGWCSAAVAMFRTMRPTASLFRVDWLGDSPVATTLYLKFPLAPTDSAFRALLEQAGWPSWVGASPMAVSHAVGLAGPTGIALRGAPDRPAAVAVYYHMDASVRGLLRPEEISKVLRAAEIRCDAAAVAADTVTLAATSPLSVVGLDGGSATAAGVLKLDWCDVPPRVARAFVSSKGAPPLVLARLDYFASALRGRLLSYLSTKYDSAGFVGWRAYFSTEPHRYVPAGLPRMHGRQRPEGARLPHY